MTDYFSSYFSFLFSPFAIHNGMRKKREHQPVEHFKSIESGDYFVRYDELNFQVGILISWLFYIVQVAYTLVGIKLGLVFFEKVKEETTWDTLLEITSLSSFTDNRILIFSALLSTVFFPLLAWFYVKFWIIIVSFMDSLFVTRENRHHFEKVYESVVVSTLPSHTFLLIPILGPALKEIGFLFLLYSGLRANLNYNFSQAFVVLLTPIFLLGFLLVSSGFLIALSINLI